MLTMSIGRADNQQEHVQQMMLPRSMCTTDRKHVVKRCCSAFLLLPLLLITTLRQLLGPA